MSKTVQQKTHQPRERRILPDANLLKIGGGSVIDRGKNAILPLIKTIGRLATRHRIIVATGGGIRERHTYAVGMDLGLPTGALAAIAEAAHEQNALLIQCLLAPYGGIRVTKDEFEKLPFFLASKAIPVIVAMPPYHYWEYPSQKEPLHGSDTGALTIAETFGMKRCILIKDIDGVYRPDHVSGAPQKPVKKITAKEMLSWSDDELPVERQMLQVLLKARNCKKVYIINGLKPQMLERVLQGKNAGTVITAHG